MAHKTSAYPYHFILCFVYCNTGNSAWGNHIKRRSLCCCFWLQTKLQNSSFVWRLEWNQVPFRNNTANAGWAYALFIACSCTTTNNELNFLYEITVHILHTNFGVQSARWNFVNNTTKFLRACRDVTSITACELKYFSLPLPLPHPVFPLSFPPFSPSHLPLLLPSPAPFPLSLTLRV